MPLTDDYVFHAVLTDTAESGGALMEILNIILARKQDPIRAIVKNPIETPEREMEKGTVMDIKAETGRRRIIKHRNASKFFQLLSESRAVLWRQTGEFFVAGRREKYDKMRKSIVVSIIDGKLFPELELCHNIFCGAGRKTADCCSATEWFHLSWKNRRHEAGAQSDRS